jgi:hypothetical protein
MRTSTCRSQIVDKVQLPAHLVTRLFAGNNFIASKTMNYYSDVRYVLRYKLELHQTFWCAENYIHWDGVQLYRGRLEFFGQCKICFLGLPALLGLGLIV